MKLKNCYWGPSLLPGRKSARARRPIVRIRLSACKTMPINKCFSSFFGAGRGAKFFATCRPQRWFCNSRRGKLPAWHTALPPKLFLHFHFHLFTHRRLPCSTFPLHLLCIIGMEIRFLFMTYGIIHDWITSITAVVTTVTKM